MARTLKRRLGFAALGLAALGALAGGAYAYALGWRPPVADYALQGVDVSAAQGPIHWHSVRAEGAEFAYIAATGGIAGRDGRFAANWSDAAEAGLKRGAYHAYSLCQPGAEQATNFIATVPREEGALPPALDLHFDDSCKQRPTRDALLEDLGTFLGMVETHAGKPAILHFDREFDETYAIARGLDRTLWLDRFYLEPNYGGRPWVMWRATGIRRIEGVEGPVNWNVVRP